MDKFFGIEFSCKICGIFATSEKNLQMHLRGKKHKRQLQASGVIVPEEPIVCVPAGPVDKVVEGKEGGSTKAGQAPTEWNSGWETVSTLTGDNNLGFGSSVGEWSFLDTSLASMQKKKKKKQKRQKVKLPKTQINAQAILGGGLDSSETAKAKRAARFARSTNVPPPKKKCIAWSDGAITSNKTDALLKFLSRKTKSDGSDAGQVKTRPDTINADAVAVALRLAGQQVIAKKDTPKS